MSSLLGKFVKCKYCNQQNTISLCEDTTKRVGLACSLVVKCSNCEEQAQMMSSKLTRTRLYEVNLRFVYGLRCIGRGVEAGKTICALLNLPQPPVKLKRYLAYMVKLCS